MMLQLVDHLNISKSGGITLLNWVQIMDTIQISQRPG